jgi:transcriptional regulator with XRE-family HTH domain
MTTPTTIGERIRAARLAAGLSQVDTCARAGCEQTWLSKLERGAVADPASSTIARLAQAIGCSADELLGLREVSVPKAKIVRGKR